MASVGEKSSAKEVGRVGADHRELVRSLLSLSGGEIVNRILDLEYPEKMVRGLSHVDLYWLMKKIGEDDALPLLKLASRDQWQFLLDLEIWDRDRLEPKQAALWLDRLFQADPGRLSKWFFSEGELFACVILSKKIEVLVRNKDEVIEEEGLFTFDDVYYISVRDKEHEELIQNLLHRLAEEDYLRYQALMMGLAGTLIAEVEEEMYRRRNVRIAEDGFLPYDEAISIYARLKPDALKTHRRLPHQREAESDLPPVPFAPFLQVGEKSLMLEAIRRSADPLLFERVLLEFAGLCNQVISADQTTVSDAEDLIKICRKVAGYINVGLERLSGGNLPACEDCLRKNSLQNIFRVGFTLALELKWEAERWVKSAWFIRQGLRPGFWDDWGGTLTGILQKRPLFFEGTTSRTPYREFESSVDVERSEEILRRMMAVDRLLENLSSHHPVERRRAKDPLFTFHALLFNFWARKKLDIEPGFGPLSLEEVRNFFRLLRSGIEMPPFRLQKFRETFAEDMAASAGELEPEESHLLRETLRVVWDGFSEEYAWVATADLDGRSMKFILTSSSSEAAPE
jgi:Family of unknown function (DUF6178)